MACGANEWKAIHSSAFKIKINDWQWYQPSRRLERMFAYAFSQNHDFVLFSRKWCRPLTNEKLENHRFSRRPLRWEIPTARTAAMKIIVATLFSDINHMPKTFDIVSTVDDERAREKERKNSFTATVFMRNSTEIVVWSVHLNNSFCWSFSTRIYGVFSWSFPFIKLDLCLPRPMANQPHGEIHNLFFFVIVSFSSSFSKQLSGSKVKNSCS